jgi:hypothetical protein
MMCKEHLVDSQLQRYKKGEGRGKICHAISLMSKQAVAVQKWAHIMCRLGRALRKEMTRELGR